MNETYDKWFTFFLRLGAAAMFGLMLAFAKGEAWLGWLVGIAVFGLLLAQERYIEPWVRHHNDQIKLVLFWAGVGTFLAGCGAVFGLVAAGLFYPLIGWNWWMFGLVAVSAFAVLGFVVGVLAKASSDSPSTSHDNIMSS